MMIGKPKHRRRTKCPIPKSTFGTYIGEATLHFKAGHYRKALFCFDKALELQPGDQNSLVARSQCHLKLGDGKAALQDAQSAFEDNDSNAQCLLQYAEALYSMSLFEKALIAYHHGSRVRKDIDDFRLGVHKCRDAIQVAIGDRSATQIEDFDELLPLIEELKALENRQDRHCCIRPGSDGLEGKEQSQLPKPSKARSRWVAREVLGRMYFDKKYLTQVLKRPHIQGESGQASKLQHCLTEALNILEIREQFWRSQNPMYARKPGLNFNNNTVLAYEEEELKKQELCRKIAMDAAEGAVLSNLARVENALKIGRANDARLESERTIRQMKQMSTNILPRKGEFMCKALHSKGIAFEKMKKFDKSIEAFQEEILVSTEYRQFDAKSKAMDSLGRNYAFKLAFTEAAEIWEAALNFAKTSVERTYLLHEIGRCYMELQKYDIASFFASQSLEEAVKVGDGIWGMNAKILSGQIDLQTEDYESALENFNKAQEFAVSSGKNVNAKLIHDTIQFLKVLIEKQARGIEPEIKSIKIGEISSLASSTSTLR